MSEAVSEFVIDVSEPEFQSAVIERSRQVPVLVDFWASWCGPCRILGPVLEKLAEEFQGTFVLAKVNTEENMNIATQFGIRSIPNVMLFRDGRAVDQFIGALPETEVRAFLQRHCPSEADQLAAEGAARRDRGETDVAAEMFRQALAADPRHAAAHLGLARLALANGQVDEVENHLAAIPPQAPEAVAAQQVRQALMFQIECRAVGGEDVCRQRMAENPDDMDARYGVASCLAAAGQYREALEEFLAIVSKDKRYRDEAARKAMLTIFSLVGERSELAEDYRTKLAWTLY